MNVPVAHVRFGLSTILSLYESSNEPLQKRQNGPVELTARMGFDIVMYTISTIFPRFLKMRQIRWQSPSMALFKLLLFIHFMNLCL